MPKTNHKNLDSCSAVIASDGLYVTDVLLEDESRATLLTNAQRLYSEGKFRPALIGKGLRKQRIGEIRGDEIYWVDDWQTLTFDRVREHLDSIKTLLRQELFLPIKRYEGHLVRYPVGAFYKKHVDRHRLSPSRLISCVLYLGDWQAGDGGELVIYQKNRKPTTVQPLPGRLVLFDSRLLHEVLPTHVVRWSLTGWFRDDIDPKLNLQPTQF